MLRHSLLSAEQMRRVDACAIERVGDSLILMEAAGTATFNYIKDLLEHEKQKPNLLILCGTGNNGGDGLVIARHCLEQGLSVKICLVGDPKALSDTAERVYDTLPISCFIKLSEVEFETYTVMVDALFGTGLQRDVAGEYAHVIDRANQSDALKIAVDIPSGIETDSGKILGTAFKVDHTVTFFASKPGHYIMPGKDYCGVVTVVDIGIEQQDTEGERFQTHLNHPDLWQGSLVSMQQDQHKYNRGHTIVVGGAMEHVGATKLASLAALRAGSGLVSIACSQASLLAYASWVTAIMTKPYADEEALDTILTHPKVTSIAFGMGAGVTEQTRQRTIRILNSQKACVLDADALSVFKGGWNDLQPSLHSQVILTPHYAEFERVFGDVISPNQGRLQQAMQAAALAGTVIVLKGNDTIIASPDGRALINACAPIHLATAGSGDVLAGIIVAQLAQGNEPFEAAASGVWMHSQAANQYKKGMIADDIIKGLRVMA